MRVNRLLSVFLLGWLLAAPAPAQGAEGKGVGDTMLMFVGEDLDVLSIASRREESAWQAPAVAQVVTRDQIRERGFQTLSQTLDMLPGFYMAQKEWGSQVYLRGIRDSVLFLYDTVPMTADQSKSIYPVGYDLSLAPVKRIEIVRGPGSVLWGPDAFAGIVNVVPMTGKDLDGAEAGVLAGGPGDHVYGYGNFGYDGGHWDAFLSASGRRLEQDDTLCNLVGFWGDGLPPPVPPVERFGQEWPGYARYMEVSGNLSFRDWFTLSGRFSDYDRPYAMTRAEEDLTWRESRSTPFSYLKLEGKKSLDQASAVRYMGYYTRMDAEYEVIDLTFTPRESTLYGEAIYDRSFLAGRGLVTGGISYRDRQVRDAPVWDSYPPDFLGPDNDTFLPGLIEADYDTRLGSVFGQYTHKFGRFELMGGLRYDDHDSYKDHLSYNGAAVWSPADDWVLKLLYGNAYRTPFARQVVEGSPFLRQPQEGGQPDLEGIETLSAQAAWQPSKKLGLGLCAFLSGLDNHVTEDPYAGISQPNSQDIFGIEAEAWFRPFEGLELAANLTLMDNHGPEESYVFVESVFVRPDGSVGIIWGERTYPYDIGADTLFNFTATWRPLDWLTAFLRVRYFSERLLIYPRAGGYEAFRSTDGVWLADLTVTARDLFMPGVDLELAVRNLTDEDYETPGTYAVIPGEPLSATVMLRVRW